MRRALRGIAMALAAGWIAGAVGCASGRHQDTADAAATATASASGSPAASPSPKPAGWIEQAAFNQDADGARLVLSADAPILYTAYEPRPDLLVIDLPGFAVVNSFATPAASGSLVQSIHFEPITELGKTVTRVSIAHAQGARYDVRSLGQGLAVAFESPGSAVAAAEPPAEAPPPVAVEPVATASVAPTSAPAPRPASRVEIGHALEEVNARTSEEGVEVALLGDGALAAKDFVLSNPPRIVIDLPGVKNEVRKRVVPVQSALVSRVRIAQFQTTPEPVTRIVVDLTAPTPYTLHADGERLSLAIGKIESAAVPPVVTAAPAPAPAVAEKLVPSENLLAAAPEIPSESPVAAHDEAPAQPASVTRVAEIEPTVQAEPSPSAASPNPADEPASHPTATASAAPAPVAAPVAETPVAHAESAPPPAAATKPVEPPPAPVAAAPKPSAAKPAKSKPAAREDAVFEAAAAMLDQQESPRPDIGNYQPRTIAESQSQFTGEPISLDLKDADIKDVFRTISELTGLNIVVDPEVRGTVTVKLDNVPWDQALDLILKQNGLGYVLDNNIMRIATTAKLSAEQSDRARLAEARQAAEPTRTVIKKLSYTKAAEILPVLKSVMSKRGDIVTDTRTNTLIIREIPTYMPAVLQLDRQPRHGHPAGHDRGPDRRNDEDRSGRSLGINWGVHGVADVGAREHHGPGLSQQRSHRIFDVPLATGTPIGALRLANIINSFNLDIALSAAENQGLLKIISSPKVAALTNTPALDPVGRPDPRSDQRQQHDDGHLRRRDPAAFGHAPDHERGDDPADAERPEARAGGRLEPRARPERAR